MAPTPRNEESAARAEREREALDKLRDLEDTLGIKDEESPDA